MNTRLNRDRDSSLRDLRPVIALIAIGLLLSAPHISAAQSEDPPPATESASPDAATDVAPAPTPASTSAPEAAKPGTRAYDHKLRALEERVVNLKEKIFRTKTRLLLLKERILNDVIAEARLVVNHLDDMGGSFRPVQVYYRLDGEDLKLLDNATGALDTDEPLKIFAGNVAPGNHNLQVEMIYRGDSAIFTYMNDYVFKLRANYTFYATKGKVTTLTSKGYLKGDVTYDLTDRPSITFGVGQRSYTKETLEQTGVEPESGSD